MKRLISLFALALSIGWLTGCSQGTIAALVSTLGGAASAVASIEGDSSLSAKLQTDTKAASAAVLAWKSGTPSGDVVEALNLVESDLNLFPVSNEAAALIDLAIGTTDSIITLIESKSPPAASPALSAHTAVRRVALAKPPKNADQFKAQWAAVIQANPALGKYAIR